MFVVKYYFRYIYKLLIFMGGIKIKQLKAKTPEILLILLLIIFILGNIIWTRYRYGGTTYDLKINHATRSYPIKLEDGFKGTGYLYRGIGYSHSGMAKKIVLKTRGANPGTFKKGAIVIVTINSNYGLTNYKLVKP